MKRKESINPPTYRIDVPNHDGGVFRAGRQLGSIRRKATEPHFIAVVIEDLNSLQRQLIPAPFGQND